VRQDSGEPKEPEGLLAAVRGSCDHDASRLRLIRAGVSDGFGGDSQKPRTTLEDAVTAATVPTPGSWLRLDPETRPVEDSAPGRTPCEEPACRIVHRRTAGDRDLLKKEPEVDNHRRRPSMEGVSWLHAAAKPRRLPMRKQWVGMIAVVLVGVAGAAPVSAASTPASPTFVTPFLPQGGFAVQALVDGAWQRAGDLSCDRFIRERTLVLPVGASREGQVRVRLVEHGGGAAHIDAVALGDTPPMRVAGAAEPDAMELVARRDNDVIDAFGNTIELTFPAGSGDVLRVSARVENAVNEGSPFAFPTENTFQPLTPASSFYRYVPTAAGRAPAWPERLDASRALFAEFSRPTTGHPDGVTYGWVANDRTTLYAAVEFTPDNTCDGNKDWSSVTVERGGQMREFRVSEELTRWGRPSFLATERASYRHKLYTFAIPFSELGARNAKEAGELKLAFAAYGTAAISWLSPQYWNFGTVTVGQTSSATIFTILNTNPSLSMTLGTPWYTRSGPNSGMFPLDPGTCSDGQVLLPSQSCTFQIAFEPTAAGGALDDLTMHVTFGTNPPTDGGVRVQGLGVEAIPTLGTVGLALLSLALVGFGVFFLARP
jgi:hypothetical protein